jgi:type VI protein secretion system component VasK
MENMNFQLSELQTTVTQQAREIQTTVTQGVGELQTTVMEQTQEITGAAIETVKKQPHSNLRNDLTVNPRDLASAFKDYYDEACKQVEKEQVEHVSTS